MQNLGGLLGKFKNLLVNETYKRISIQESIKEIIGIDIDISSIEIKKTIITIHERPIIKNEILIKKTQLLESIKKKNSVIFTDIR